ncbi:MAG: TonB family protein [bacterium]
MKERNSLEDEGTKGQHPFRFERKISQLYDSRFMGILTMSVIVHVAIVIYFLLNPLARELFLADVSKMQERLARTIKEREALLQEQFVQFELKENEDEPRARRPHAKKSPDAGKQASPGKQAAAKRARKSAPSMADARRQGGGTRRDARARRSRRAGKSQARIAATVSNRGVLALLTSKSAYAVGGEIADVLSTAGRSSGDLDKKIAKLTSLQRVARRGGSSGRVKGARSHGSAGIDEMVSGLGDAVDPSFERGGELVVSMDAPKIEGGAGSGGNIGRNAADVQAVILHHNKTIQYCYERELKRNPNLRGKITVRFTITSGGRVKNVELVSSTINNRSVERCVLNRIRRWNDFGEIEASYGNTTVRQTYAFGY